MNIVMVHPVHGAKVVTNVKEMQFDMANGWVEYVNVVNIKIKKSTNESKKVTRDGDLDDNVHS